LNEVKDSENRSDFANYQWLGFDSIPTKSELKSKYKKLSNIYHPDKSGCGVVMSKINEAYESLLKVAS
jgi:DnaJ-class molecular chaperone